MKRPEMVCAVLDVLDRLPKTSDHEANKFFSHLRAHSVKRLRIFLWNVWGDQKSWSQMFGRSYFSSPGEWDPMPGWDDQKSEKPYEIFQLPGEVGSGINWNEEFFDNLKRLKEIAANWRIALYVDFGDHCSTHKSMRGKHPLYNNVDGIHGMYDISGKAQWMWDEIIRKIIGIVGVGRVMVPTIIPGVKKPGPKPWYGLGNELYCQKDRRSVHSFGEFWAYPKAKLLRKLGYKLPILFSAHQDAAHAIRAYVNTEGDWYTEFRPKDTVRVFHGTDLYEHFEPMLKAITAKRGFAISDDGTNCKDMYRKAICVNVDRYCSADKLSVMHLVKTIWLYMRTIGYKKCYFHHIEQLPRSVSETYQSLGNLDHKRDMNVYPYVARDVFDKDINWRIPRWMKKRFLKKKEK